MADPIIAKTGFREYDARWRYPEDIDLAGMTRMGLGLGTQMHAHGLRPEIVVGCDYRSYSEAVKSALCDGLVAAGITVTDIGTCLSPTAYFARQHLNKPAVAMLTASHNPNGWTGVKVGFEHPLTHGPDEMAELRDIVLGDKGIARAGGKLVRDDTVIDAYLDDLAGDLRLSRPLRVVVATGNGTASFFAPKLLERIGATVIPRHTTPDHSFPNYNPNPEAMEMLHDMTEAVRESDADLALGFDGDGDRCGVVADNGEEIFSDKMGLMLARDLAPSYPGAILVADVKSTGLFAVDPILKKHGVTTDYWKTGHSYLKRRVHELGALAGFERSGHYYLAGPIGRGYDCGLRVAVEILKFLDRHPDQALSDLYAQLQPTYGTPTFAPFCSDATKYQVLERIVGRIEAHAAAGGQIAGKKITQIVKVNGARVILENGAWGLVRASSNTPNLVVVCESPESDADTRTIFHAIDDFIRTEPEVGPYDQPY